METVIREFKLPIVIGRKSMDYLFKEISYLEDYDYDVGAMWQDGVVTKQYLLEHILSEEVIFFKRKLTVNYKMVKPSETYEHKLIAVSKKYNIAIVDLGNKFDNQEDRKTIEYKQWRDKVFKRDKYTCQHCGKRGRLNAHHIKSYKDYPKLRTKLSNGITLCKQCHIEEHKRLRGN